MAIAYTNPYSGAWYYGYFDAINNGPIPLQPCAGAYSIGPALTDTDLSVAWISYGFNLSASTDLFCNLIKDENDVFYYVCYSSGVRIDEYIATSGTSTVYNPSTPAELTTFLAANSEPHWMIRKASATVLDLVISGYTDGGATRNFEHYTWTIGAASMTYVGGFSHTIASYAGNLCAGIHGSVVVDGYFDSPSYYLKTYNLDTQAVVTTEMYDRTDNQSSCVEYIYAGSYFYVVVIASSVAATGNCPDIYGGTVNPRTRCIMTCSIYAVDLDGTITTISGIFDEVAGHDCYFNNVSLSGDSYIGIKPDSGIVYINLSYKRAWSAGNCPSDPYIPGFSVSPDFAQALTGIYQIGPGAVGAWVNTTTASTSTTLAGYTNTHTVAPGRWNLPHHNNPASLSDTDADNLPSIFLWPDLTEGTEGIFTPAYYGGAIGQQVSDGGQRNNNTPISLSTHYKDGGSAWHNVVRDLYGNIYLDQTSDLSGGTTTNFLPVTGYMGKYPVRFYIGRWAIFGPNTYVPTLGPNWQVV